MHLWYKRIPIRKLATRRISHTHVTSRLQRRLTIAYAYEWHERAAYTASFGKGGGGGGGDFYINRIIKLPLKSLRTFTRKLTWYIYVLHMNMPEHVRDNANMGGQILQILKLLNVMVTSFCIYGGGGGGGGLGNWGSSRLTRLPESDPNAHGRVCGIALLCVQMKNHHTSRRE